MSHSGVGDEEAYNLAIGAVLILRLFNKLTYYFLIIIHFIGFIRLKMYIIRTDIIYIQFRAKY